ncbi:Uncharacterized protein DAT39_006454, partial [Clarias magur]
SDSVLYIYAVRYMKTSLYVQDNLFLKAKLNQMILLHSDKVLTAAGSERIIIIVMVTSSWHVSCLAVSFLTNMDSNNGTLFHMVVARPNLMQKPILNCTEPSG